MATSFSPSRSILLQPIITGALLVASLRYPRETQKIVSELAKDIISVNTLQAALKALLAAGAVYRTNKYLERLALNNWVSNPTWDPSKEIVVVTGGSSGIGAAIVNKFAEQKVKVVILDISPPPASKRTKPEGAANTRFYQLDVTSTAAIKATAAQIRAEVGEPTVLVNNAGIGSGQLILDEGEETLERVVGVNLTAHFKLVREFLPAMIRKDHGHVVSVASLASFVALASGASYSATKAGVLAFHEGLAGELKNVYGAKKVRTTVVHPVWVRTALTARMLETAAWKKSGSVLLEPDDVAGPVVAQVVRGESAQLILPRALGYVATLRAWPHWLQIFARDQTSEVLRKDTK